MLTQITRAAAAAVNQPTGTRGSAESTTETKGVYDDGDATCIPHADPRNRFKTPPQRKEGVRRRQAPVTRPPATDDNGDDG